MNTQALAYAFCAWPLPESVCPDPCARMPGYPNRSGTNLLTVAEAKAMFDYLVEQGLLREEQPASVSEIPNSVLAEMFKDARQSAAARTGVPNSQVVLVPETSTREMNNAGEYARLHEGKLSDGIYEAMLAVAPTATSDNGRFHDLVRLLNALGLGDHARPMSSAQVFDLCLKQIGRLCEVHSAAQRYIDGHEHGPVYGANDRYDALRVAVANAPALDAE